MQTENYNSLGGTFISLALYAQRYIFGLRYLLVIWQPINKKKCSEAKKTSLFKQIYKILLQVIVRKFFNSCILSYHTNH